MSSTAALPALSANFQRTSAVENVQGASGASLSALAFNGKLEPSSNNFLTPDLIQRLDKATASVNPEAFPELLERDNGVSDKNTIYMFVNELCPHCQSAVERYQAALNNKDDEYHSFFDNHKVKIIPIVSQQGDRYHDNIQLFSDIGEAGNISIDFVPFLLRADDGANQQGYQEDGGHNIFFPAQ